MRTVLVTGSAGFIGFHLSQLLLEEGFRVVGFDGMTDYYDVRIKQRRHQMLLQHPHFSCTEGMLEDFATLHALALAEKPDVIVHLAAQAGVRYSLENPRAYVDANLIGTFNVMECARELGVDHLLMASTSSVYGANTEMPFGEDQKCDTPLTLYAATKKANEAMAHSYAHLWNLPTTMFRFFTVYGPWGRPDMALFKFTRGILEGTPIDIYNDGEMYRDFTYVADLVRGAHAFLDVACLDPVAVAPGPHPGIAVCLKFQTDRKGVGLAGAALLQLADLVRCAQHVLDVVAVFVRHHIDPREIAARAHPAFHFGEEIGVDVDAAVGGAIERPHRALRRAAA